MMLSDFLTILDVQYSSSFSIGRTQPRGRLRRWQFSERCQCRGLLGCRRAKAYQNATHNDGEDEDSTKGARQADASARVLGVAVVQPTRSARGDVQTGSLRSDRAVHQGGSTPF